MYDIVNVNDNDLRRSCHGDIHRVREEVRRIRRRHALPWIRHRGLRDIHRHALHIRRHARRIRRLLPSSLRRSERYPPWSLVRQWPRIETG